MIRTLSNANGVTVADLRRWLATVPDCDRQGIPHTVWIESDDGVASPACAVAPLDAHHVTVSPGVVMVESCDVLLSRNVKR